MNLKYAIEIADSAENLFELTQDYAVRAIWDPLTTEAYLIDGGEPAAGKRVRCTARNGLSMDTVYVSYKPGRVAAVKLVRGPYIFRSFAGGWRFEPLGERQTRVRFSYTIATRPRWLAWLLTPVVAALFRRETVARLKALKAYAENRSGHRPDANG